MVSSGQTVMGGRGWKADSPGMFIVEVMPLVQPCRKTFSASSTSLSRGEPTTIPLHVLRMRRSAAKGATTLQHP